ncbi:MAG: tetratricopeptide repeat protein [Deltaproteobacteria bacterium]|nr:tetratricopeptide repeat protein [Deltaproteobacteria bacterium]
MSVSVRIGALILGASLVAPGCAYYGREDGERLANEVYALQTQVTALQQALAQMQEDEKAQREQLGQITQELAELSKIARRNDADITVQIDDMLETVSRMKGRVESFDERLSGVEATSSKVQEELDLRFQELAEKQKMTLAKTEAEKTQAIEDAKKRERLLGDADAAFKEIERLIGVGQPADARKLLRELQVRNKGKKDFAKHEARVQFLIGETYFAEGSFQQAAAEYNAVRKKFASSKWVADALFKLGMCFEKLNLPEDAKIFYETVKKKYKKSSVAKDAQKRLDALKK